MEYSAERESSQLEVHTYHGYIDGKYAGQVSGIGGKKFFDIKASSLNPEFRGTKCVRALSEIVKAVHKDYKCIRTRIDNKDNGEIKMILSLGFHIIGTVSYKDEIAIELLKIMEDTNG